MKSTISKMNLLAVIAALVLTGFSTNFIYNYSGREKLPTRLDERPQMLYGFYGNLDNPMGIAVGNRGNLYISDPGSHMVKIFNTRKQTARSLGQPGTGKGQLNYPYGIAISSSGNLLVADSVNRRVSIFSTTGKFIKDLIPANNQLGLLRPGAITVDGNLTYVSDLWGHQVVVVDSEGKLVRKIGSPGSEEGKLKYPQSMVIDAQHRIWVADTGNNRIQIFDRQGKFLFIISGEKNQLNLSLLRGMATDNLQRVLVADAISSKILVFDNRGNLLFSFGGQGKKEDQLKYPMGLWIAEDGRIYIADRGNDRVQVWGYKGR